ncbi:DNA polymerase III subunit gamma/tau [Blochmannia endosymbiont of Camponotus (Colobopsis) obliquus]|uniref:DNA polymerase III subunit gamma/tau n=1 Tax=Blochmannia endosymbiont of Camponotus (Colobopsis) obliquus TaxID=1505597 RepID=UPI00061A5719|nr:DNA polymerase III subunit gamma/tau [Blochmannia endosymbiont of Camponotus (Colobopsis) obliquus]AKC60468.1 DNA polymerase III subunit tau [Blochmannia endosymbiont of Camponotus (Colobopsis) obliquus]
MSYQVLARKWRPQVFTDVIGQQHVIKTITNSFLLGKMHHAYLFSGVRGIGKTTIARLFAKGLSCTKGITINPCRECKNCCDIERGCFIDLIEVDAATRTKVEDIRDLLSNIQYMPVCGKFKIYLIDEVHMLSRHSFNALLKILEEPPEHIKFILLTTEKHKLPVTVLSRCLQLHLKALDVIQICDYLMFILKQEGIEYDSDVLRLLSCAANGSVRDALTLVDQAIVLGMNKITSDVTRQMFGLLNSEQPILLLESLIYADSQLLMKQIAECAELGVDWEFLLIELLSLLQKLAVDQILSTKVNGIEGELKVLQRLRLLNNYLAPSDLQLLYQILLVGRQELPFAPNYRMGFEMTLLRALAFHPLISKDLVKETSISFVNKVECDMSYKDNIVNCNEKMGAMGDNLANAITEKSLPSNKLMLPELFDSKDILSSAATDNILSEDMVQLLQARAALTKLQNMKKHEQHLQSFSDSCRKSITSILGRFADINKRAMESSNTNVQTKCERSLIKSDVNNVCSIQIKSHVYDKKTLVDLMQEVITQDDWSAQINKLFLSDLARQLAIHSWKENLDSNVVCLHLRSDFYHLNSEVIRNELQEALSNNLNTVIELIIKIDNDTSFRTPFEWCQYVNNKQKALKNKDIIIQDMKIKKIQKVFDAELEDVNN